MVHGSQLCFKRTKEVILNHINCNHFVFLKHDSKMEIITEYFRNHTVQMKNLDCKIKRQKKKKKGPFGLRCPLNTRRLFSKSWCKFSQRIQDMEFVLVFPFTNFNCAPEFPFINKQVNIRRYLIV